MRLMAGLMLVCKLFHAHIYEVYPTIIRNYLSFNWPRNLSAFLYCIRYGRQPEYNTIEVWLVVRDLPITIIAYPDYISRSHACTGQKTIYIVVKNNNIRILLEYKHQTNGFKVHSINNIINSPICDETRGMLNMMQRIFPELVGRIAM